MICPKCETNTIGISHTYVTDKARITSGFCKGCKTRYTIHTGIVYESKDRGDGATALAQRIRRGEVEVEIVVRKKTGPAS